jgi:hypothetical protein
MLHDIGENVLIIHPYLILDEEIVTMVLSKLRTFTVVSDISSTIPLASTDFTVIQSPLCNISLLVRRTPAANPVMVSLKTSIRTAEVAPKPAKRVIGFLSNRIGMQKSGGRRVKRVVYFDFRSVRLVDETLKRNLLAKHFATEDSFKLKESLQKAIDKDIQEGKDIEDLKNPAALAPTNLQLYRKFMEKYLRQRPEVNTDLTLMVRHMEATQCGLPIEFYFFIKDKVWVNYEHILADIMEHAYALANEFGLKIYEQYPEQ